MSSFWRTWLKVWCVGVGLFGLVLAGAAFEATSGPTRLVYGLIGGPAMLDMDATLRFSIALMGAVTLGWSVTMFAAIEAACLLGDRGRPVWRLITVSLGVWYVVDSSLSVATGFGLNAVSNTLIVAAYLVPVLMSGVMRGPAQDRTAPQRA